MADVSNFLYAGRWVARLRGKIVAQGETPEQALQAAQLMRHKERPEIIFMLPLPPLVEKVKTILPPEQEICLVGGAVRDLLLSRRSPDFDFALPAQGVAAARKVANALRADFLVLDEKRDISRVVTTDEYGARVFLDFTAYRGATLEEDLRARDFTINAIAYNLRDETLIDPTGGGKDMREKIIRACSATSLSDDPARILRAVRQAVALNFRIEKETRELMKQATNQLGRISPERLRDEVFKMLGGAKPNVAMRAVEMLGVFPHLMPELSEMKDVTQSAPHVHDVWTHTLAVLDHLDKIIATLRVGYDARLAKTNDMFTGLLGLRLGRYREQIAAHLETSLNVDRPHRGLLFFAALYHDVSKPEKKTVEESGRIRFFEHEILGADVVAMRTMMFNMSVDEIDRLETIVKNHMRIHHLVSRIERENKKPSRRSIYRFFRDVGAAGIDLILLALADLRATYAHSLTLETWTNYLDVARLLLENYWERPEEAISPPRLLDGNELMKELEIKPSPLIGQLLESIRENQAAGKIETREQALAFAREKILNTKDTKVTKEKP